jgi:lipoprotein-anchoring transpeptidase ErfK/SrfK
VRLDSVVGGALAVLLVGQVMTVSVREAHQTRPVTTSVRITRTVDVPAKPTHHRRAPHRHHGHVRPRIVVPRQPSTQIITAPVAPNRQVSRHYRLPVRLRALIPTSTVLVHLVRTTPGFASPTDRKPEMHIPAQWYGHWSVLPVIATKNFRLKVRLPRRPNGSTTWVRITDVRYSRTPYAVLVDLSLRRLFWFDAGRQLGSYPVGIGSPADPTPTGSYFVAFHSPPPDPGYGPVVLATSAHSNVIQDFGGGGDAIIAIHGPIDAAGVIGSSGAAISHGCIRMQDADLAQIRGLPDGTPVIITY